jgi:RHS repeat-associated protein
MKPTIKFAGQATTTLAVALIALSAVAQTPTQNYIRSRRPVAPVTELPALNGLEAKKQGATISYFDGLGRPAQTVAVGQTPAGHDLVQGVYYDGLGRQSQGYLPYEKEANGGAYRAGWMNELKASNLYPSNDTIRFSETVYDGSPLNRVASQRGVGSAWRNADRKVSYSYGTNAADGVSRFTVTPSGEVAFAGPYPPGALHLTATTDEDNGHSREYKDFQGRVVLKEAQLDANTWAKTYYVYDDLGNLRWVLPPKLVASLAIEPGWTMSPTAPLAQQLAYCYRYDGRRRLIEKQLPGAAPVYLVYDHADRLVLSQDGNQRVASKWQATLYDQLGRPVQTGLVTLPTPSATQSVAQTWYSGLGTSCGTTVSNLIAGGQRLSGSWYDSYSSLPAEFSGLTYQPVSGLAMPAAPSSRTVGMPVAQEIAVLNPEDGKRSTLRSKSFYDDEGRLVQTVAELYDGGLTRSSFEYSWQGLALKEDVRNEGSPLGAFSYTRHTDYDHAGRVIAVRQQVNGGAQENVAIPVYDALGRVTKQQYAPDTKYWSYGSGVSRTEEKILEEVRIIERNPVITIANALTVSYKYNVRGWLTDINDIDNPSASAFALRLGYNASGLNRGEAAAQYSGNISEAQWAYWDAPTGTVKRVAYGYTYDGLNRLTQADWYERSGSAWQRAAGRFDTQYTYDANGNIDTLMRFGNITTSTYGYIDKLSYRYKGNQLTKVTDNSASAVGFLDGANKTTEYLYDANGSMVRDRNRNLAVEYNALNLPQVVSDTLKTQKITYVYTAAGQKLASLIRIGSTLQEGTRYNGPVVYSYAPSTGWTAEYAPTPEGKLVPRSGGWVPQYFMKDHLGNVRAIVEPRVATAPQLVWQQQGYYPFGMALGTVYVASEQNDLMYNGKELQTYAINGKKLDWYDYGARFYDPQIGRWHVIDTYSEDYYPLSPYNYVANNPINSIDIKGDSIWVVFKDANGKILEYGSKEFNKVFGEVQKMFNEEFGISVTYNGDTQMMGFGGDVDSELSQSNTATGILKEALMDDNSRQKGFMDHGKIVFGHNLRDEVTGLKVDEGSWTGGIAHIDLGDYNGKTGRSNFFNYYGVPTRSHNLARAFEEEYLGHNYLNRSFDGGAYSLSKVNKQANLYIRERGLPERLNYGDSYTPIYFGNSSTTNSSMIRKMVKGTINPTIHLKRKKQ